MVDLNKIRLTRAALSGRIVIARFGRDERVALDHRDATSEFYQTLVSAAFDGKVPVAGSVAGLSFGGGDEQYVALIERKKEGSEQDWCADSVLDDTAAHIACLVGPNAGSQAVEKAVSDALRALRGFATMRMRQAEVQVPEADSEQDWNSDETLADAAALIAGLVGPNDEARAVEKAVLNTLMSRRALADLHVSLIAKERDAAKAEVEKLRDFGGDALALTEAILLNLGFGCEVSKEPGVDRRRDRIAAVIDKFILDLVLAREEAQANLNASRRLVELRTKERDREQERGDGNYDYWQAAEARCTKLAAALAPLVEIADAYDDNALDDEARKFWGEHGIVRSDTPPEKVELYAGRGGRRLLTLAQCLAARDAVEPAEAPANVIEVGTAKDLTHWVVDKLFEELVGLGVDPNLIASAMENIADKQEAEDVPVACREVVAPRAEDVKPLIAALASVVRIQNGNQHADINALLARADAALAATQETNHGR